MIILETIIFVLMLMMLISIVIPKVLDRKIFIVLWSLIFLLIVIHLFSFGTRWQLYFLYLAILISGFIIYFLTISQISLKTFVRRTLLISAIVLFVISGLSILSFPMYELPSANGPFHIGTESFVIEDESRLELYNDDPLDYRRIKIQIWYPADTIEGYEQAPWLADGKVVSQALSKDFSLPSFVLNHTEKIMSNSYLHAPISDALDHYPVIILSHGWRGFRNIHTDYAEELASEGYIVVGIDHTYGSVATVFEDEVIYLNSDALPERDQTPNFLEYANQLVTTYGSDVSTTINYLEDLNDDLYPSRFVGKLDLNRIGLIGHSTGGGGDVVAAQNDDRIDSIIGLDAWVEPIEQSEILKGLEIPSLFIRSETWESGENNENLFLLIDSSPHEPELYQINGTTHFDFAMVYMYSPLAKSIGLSGHIDSRYLLTIIKSMMIDFFDETLRNDLNSQIDPNEWEEVIKLDD
ncbi:MAG: hypothetical protein ACLFPM_04700 [Candidatus Izemoplasmatales bacterium]